MSNNPANFTVEEGLTTLSNETEAPNNYLGPEELQEEVPNNDEANEAWEELEKMFTNFDKFLSAQINRYRFMLNLTNVLDDGDLMQHAMIGAYEAWCDKRDKTPRYLNYMKRVRDYHQLSEEETESNPSIFAGYIRRKIMWELIDVNESVLGYGADSEGVVSAGKQHTYTASELSEKGEEEMEDFLDFLSAGILESDSESIDEATLRHFEKFFHVDTGSMDPSEAKKLRQILYEATYESIEEEQREMAQRGSGTYRKVTDQAINTRAAVFDMIVEGVAPTKMSERTGVKMETLKKDETGCLCQW